MQVTVNWGWDWDYTEFTYRYVLVLKYDIAAWKVQREIEYNTKPEMVEVPADFSGSIWGEKSMLGTAQFLKQVMLELDLENGERTTQRSLVGRGLD